MTMLQNISSVCLRECLRRTSPVVGCFRPLTSEKPTDSAIANHTPNLVDKYLLVWLKKYPSVKDVPNRVTQGEMEKVRNWARIKISIGICIATVFGCIYMVKAGKDAAKKGESVKKMNLDWHKSMSEKEK